MQASPCGHSACCIVITGEFIHFHTNSKHRMSPKMHVITLYDVAIT